MERLDGNALGGLLGELFAPEMTAARGRCAACGTVLELGAEHVYAAPQAPGAVVRCAGCENELMVVVRGRDRWWLGCRGLSWIEMRR